MGNNKELPVNPETGTAATKSWKLDPVPGTTNAGFQETKPKSSNWKLDPIEKSHIDTSSSVTNLDWGKYEKYIDQAFIPEGGVDELTKARARNQSTWEQLGNQAVQTTAGVLFGIAENAGYLFDLEAHASTVTGVGNDYSNFLTEFAQRGRQALEDNFSVYRENPEQVFDLGDPAWWIGHGGNLIESIGEFAVTGYGVGKVLGGGAKALAMAFKNSSKGAQIAKGLSAAASTLTAAELAYVEGAMGGQEVYKLTYDRAVEEGLSQEEAITKASKAAATTVQLNTLINTGLNVTAARMFTRPMGGARKLDQAFGKQLGESLTDWKARLAAGSKQPSAIAALGLEAGQESLEEVVNELATALGERKGKELLGILSEKEEKGGKLATILETLGKDETMLAAILGAMGGIGQTAITSQLPTAKARKEAETKAQQKQLQYVIDRVDSFEAAQAKLSSASKEGDSNAYYQALNDVFATEAFHSIINGTEDQLAGIYQEVANMSEEEAEAAGYDIDPTSIDNYKRRATEAIEDIKKLSKDYEQIINQYNAYDSEAAETGYGENVFKKHLHRHNVERTIDRAQERVNKAKSEHLKNLQRRGTSMDVETAIEIQNDMKAVEQSVANLGQEIQDVISTDARGKAGKRSLETKYGTPPKGTSRKQHAINQIEKRAKRMMKQRDKYASELTKAQQNFITAGNKLEDFNDALNATSQEQAAIISATSTIFENREILKDIDADFKEFSSKTGRDEFVKTRQEEAATQAAETKKEEDSKKAEEKVQEENEKREAAAQPAKEKKAKAKESETQPVDTEVETDPTTDIPVANTEVAPDPEFADEQEINKDIVSEGLATSQETAPSPIMEDGDVQNPSEKKKSKMTEVEPSKSTSDFVVVQAANTFAYLSNQYEEKDGRKETVTSDKAKGLARELESSVEFQPGDTITLEIDRTATWQDKAGQTWSYNDFVNEDGSVDEANVPIAIKKNGRTVAYVRTNDWILQKQEGSDEFANVANSTDPDSAMYNNADLQAKINLALRKDVIKQGSIETTIVNKSVGTLNHNLVDGKRTKGKMSELTPKVKTLAVVKNGQFHVNKDDIYSDRALANSKKFLESLDENNGLVFAELVTPNGTVLMVPVSIPNLNETQAETIYNALEAKLTNNKSVISQVFGETDFDLSTDSGILNFLRLFTHTTDESEANLKQKVDGDGKDVARYLNYSTKTGAISYARHNRGIVTINTIEELQANKADLLAFLGEKLFSVRLSAINKSDSVSEPVIKADGTVETNHYNNYNDYVKTSLETDVKGNAINENEESYFNQPVIEFSLSFVNSPIQKTGEVAKTKPSPQSTQPNKADEIKADIEKRRQESNKNQLNEIGSNRFLKFNKEGENTELSEVELKLINSLIDRMISQGKSAKEINAGLIGRGFVQSQATSPAQIETYLQSRIDGKINSKVGESISQEINAKYDAELNALESKQEVVEETKLSTNVKEGVTELFESNPELANSVYEALGFTAKSKKALLNIDERVKKEVSILNKLLALTKKGNFNEAWDKLFDLVIDAEKNKTNEEYIALIEFQKEVDKYFGYLINTINDKSVKDTAISDEIKNIKEEAEKDKLKKRRVTSEEKQQAQQLYSQYIEQTGKQDIEGFKEFIQNNKKNEIVEDENVELDQRSDEELLNDIDSLLGFDDSIQYESTPEPVNDSEMSDLQQQFLKDGLAEFLVVDKETNIPYNAYKQSQVVSSIIELTVKAMQTGDTATQAFNKAKAVFAERQRLYKVAENSFDKLTDVQKQKLAITSIQDAQELHDEFEKVNRNWTQFEKYSKETLLKLFGIKETLADVKEESEATDTLDGFEELESHLEKVSFDDGATFQTNHKDTASARLKLFLALQESPTRTFLNLKSFIPFDTVYDELTAMLAGTEPNYDAFIRQLYLRAATKPYAKTLIAKLESSDQQIKNEFVVAFSKQYNKFTTTLWSINTKNDKSVLQLQNIESNRNDVIKRIEAQWVEDQKISPIVKSVGGKLTIDPEVANEIRVQVINLAAAPTIEGAQELLAKMGITMPIEALKYLEENSVRLTGKTFAQNFKTGIFKHMSDAFFRTHDANEQEEVESLLDLNNPLTGIDREGSSIKMLATLASQFSDSIYSNSHRDSEGKTIYSYSLNTALSHKMRELTADNGNNASLNGLSKISFSKYSYWAEQLRTNSKFRENFGVFYLDGLAKRRSNQPGVKRSKQSDREMELQAIAMFQNQGREQAFFIYPTISDKTTTPVISALKHNVKVMFNEDGTYTFGKTTKKLIHDLVRSEIDRIENYKPGKEKIKGYDTGGATKFFLFPGLNEILGDERLPDGRIPVDIQTKLFAAAENHIKELVNSTVKSWEDLGIKTDDNLMFDRTYMNTVLRTETKGANLETMAKYAAIDQEINYILANANVMQLISGDPAQYFKKDVETTMVEYTKRLAKDIAPGLDGNFSKPKYRTVFLKDKETNSQHLEQYKKILGEKSSSYTGMEGTDAQEYTTLEEHLNVMYAYGKISDAEYSRFLEMAREGKDFSGKELDIILQPMKPVYVGNEFDFERDLNKITYIKSSAFPLIPQLTKGLEIDTLRKEMEKHKIDRAAYVTAAKLGSTKAVDIWDGDAMVDTFTLEGKAVTLDRSGFRIQQEVPYKEDKVKILTVSQMNKLLFEGILAIEGMPELKARKEEIRKELFKKGKEKLLKSIGAKEVNGEYIFEDLSKIQDVLIKEARDRGYPINDIQALELTEDKKAFRIPIGFNASSKKFESVLMSLITNNILKQKIAGKSYVQASSAGILTGANKSKKWSELTSKELGGIVFVGDVNLDTGLKFVRKEDGKVRGAQLLVPFYFRNSEGKPLNIKDYTKEVGGKLMIDPDKMDSELLKLVGARIPNQGHSSMLPIEIVGFLPESMGDLIIVPDEITKQMGADFDVDKLYTYQYEYTIGEDGKLTKEDSLKNEYVDIHWKVLTHPEVLPRVLAPLDQKGEYSVAGEAAKINEIRSKNAKKESFLYRRNQQRSFMQNRGGKSGVGIFSLASTFNATIQDQNLYLGVNTPKGPVPVTISVFKGFDLTKLSGKGANPIADKAAVISDMQSAAVDNAKEQTLDKLNLNDYTFKVANAMAQLEDKNGKNLTIQHISRLLSQQIILDYVKEVEKLSDSTIDNFIINKEEEAMRIVKEKYEKNATTIIGNFTLDLDNMLTMIENEAAPNGEWYSQQLLVLEAFAKFYEVGSTMSNIQSAINSDSKGVDPSFFQVTEKLNRINEIGKNPIIRGAEPLLSSTTEVGTATEMGPKLAKALMSKFLPQGSNAMNEVFNQISRATGRSKMNADMKQRIFDDFKAYVFTSNGLFAGDPSVARADLMIDNETPSLATRVKEAQQTWGKHNFLLRRLMAKFSDVKGDPSTVEYVASTGERLDEQESLKAFIDMLASTNPEQSKLAEDLVRYSYLTSGTQHANNFMKFIPNIYLKAIGADQKLRDFDWGTTRHAYDFTTQFIQNNPDFATKVGKDFVIKDGTFTLPKVDENLPKEFLEFVYSVTESDGSVTLTYPSFFQTRQNNEYQLYMKVAEDSEGTGEHIYQRVDVLGGKGGVVEYDSNKRLGKSMYSKNTAGSVKPIVKNVPSTKVSSSTDNPNAYTEPLKKYGLKSSMPSNEFMESVKKISSISDNPGHRLLADILYGIKANLKPFTFNVDNKLPIKGRFRNDLSNDGEGTRRTISINPSMFETNGSFSSNDLEATILHELIHGYTSQILKAYDSGLTLPANVTKACKSLNAVREKLFKSLSEQEKADAEAFDKLSPEEKRDSKLPRSLKAKYYALYNNVEFITMTLTDVEFQKFLNEIPFEGSKTLLDRLIEVVSNLYKAIANAAGIEVKQDSALEAAINESINLLANVSPISAEFNQVNDSISLSTQYDPVNPRLLDQIRSEFGLRNEKGSAGRFLHTDKGYAKAVARALELNTKNKKFMEKYGDKYKAFVTKAFGEKGDTRVYYVISFTEITSDDYSIDFGEDTTISPSIKKIVSRLQSRIRELNRSMSESKSNKVAYQEKIDALEKQIERLEEENSLKEISAVAKTHLDWASNILDHKKITASELKEVEQIINVWRDVKSLFKDDYQSGGKYQEVLSQISNRAEDLEIKYLDMAKAVMIEEINATSTRQVKMKDLELMADITSTRANMLDLSHVDNPVAQALDTWLKNSARDTNTEFTMVAKDIKTEFDKLKEHPEFKKNGFDIFLQKDKNGKWTGGLVNRYSQDWYDARAKSWAKVRRDKGNTKKWADHFKWLRENEVMVDTGVLFEQDGSHKSDGTYKKHVKELINEFGETRANEMIQQAQDKYMDYLQDLDAFILSTEAEMEVDSEITQEMSDAKIQRWKLENSPKAYISNYKGGLIVQGLKMRGYKYTVSKPRKTVNGKKTKWYDSSYEKIENDPVLNQFYNFYRSAMAKNMSVLPTYALKDTQANFIPFVKKQLIEQFTTSGLKGSMVGLWENFADSISSIESSTVSADRNMRTGNVNKRIPIKFLQEGDITDKSTNLIKALEMFTLMSLNYKHKSKVEDKALILQRLINEASQKQVTANNEVQRDTEGNLYETKDGNVNLKKLVQHTIDYTLYNKRRNEGDATGIFIADSPKNSIKATKLAKQIKDLNRKLSLGTITNEEHSKQVEPLQKELDELGGKNVSTADIADFTMKITQLKGMALNIFSASNNMTFGLVSNIIHASGGEDFTMKEALQAYRIMLNSTSKSLFLNRAGIGEKTAKKLNALVEKFDVLFEVNEAAYRGNNKDKSGISKLSPYELQKRGEYFVQGMNMVARMLNEKVTTKDGKETSLFEAFDENGNWRTDVYGENSGWNGDISDDNQMKDFRKFRNRLTQINKRIHGNYDPASFPMIKKSVLGRFAMQFRSWLAESVASRFDHEQWDEQLGRNTKGTYRTIGQLGPMQTIKAFAKIAIGKGNGISDISAVDQANLRKAFTELAFIIGLNIMALSVMALSDDDDEDKMVRNIAINQLYRVQADLTFYMTPSSFDRILSNPVPAIRTYLDAERAMAGTIQYIMQDEELDGRKKLESEDVWLKILKAFPLVNQLPKATTQAEKVFK